ncbi:hypothetical protein COLO4_31026 [Corchorus olitorius]|uniref:F-box domain-containing protein n=1 Tax=Corchorus olitorius TaxID=93759 RepID=A0A1R3H607_9ROSI|nr:hypothetical protein COLO4_31026 [Corchorus olitorius]
MGVKTRKMALRSQVRKMDDENEGIGRLQVADLLMEIFLRLPIMALGKCRCVCKTWFRIISSPEFAKLHLSVSPTCILIKNKPPKRESRRLLLSQVFEDSCGTNRFRFERMDFTQQFHLPNIGSFSLVNSCNGLVCLFGIAHKLIYVCNPVLGEYITIQVPHHSDPYDRSFGLGFCSITNEFKVLHTFRTKEPGMLVKAVIYTLGTRLWRSIENVPNDITIITSLGFDSLLHGTLHWATVKANPNLCRKITCFKFEKDLFGEIPVPPQFELDLAEPDLASFEQLRLGVYDGCLSACCFRPGGYLRFDIWVMKEYGVKKSWVAEFHIYSCLTHFVANFYYPLIFLKDSEIMISFNNKLICSYIPGRDECQYTRLARTTGEFDAVGYTPCFVSLDDVAKGERINRYPIPTMLLLAYALCILDASLYDPVLILVTVKLYIALKHLDTP